MATVQIPIPILVPDASGNGYPILYDASPHRHLVPAFLQDVVGSWYGHFRVPQDYSLTPKIIVSIGANATTGTARLTVASYCSADAESYDGTYTVETAQEIGVPATAYLRKDVTFTLASSPAVGDDVMFRVEHEGTATNDTLAVPTIMFSAVFQYATA